MTTVVGDHRPPTGVAVIISSCSVAVEKELSTRMRTMLVLLGVFFSSIENPSYDLDAE